MNLCSGDIIRCHRVRVESYQENIQLIGNPRKGCAFVTFHRKLDPKTGFEKNCNSNSNNKSNSDYNNNNNNNDNNNNDKNDFNNQLTPNDNSKNHPKFGRDPELDSELCHLSHGSEHPGLSSEDWEVRHTSEEFTFDEVNDTEMIQKIFHHGVSLFLKHPFGDVTKTTLTLSQLLEKIESNEESISATLIHTIPIKKSKNILQKTMTSQGVGDDIALTDKLLRSDRADILCMVAGVVEHAAQPFDNFIQMNSSGLLMCCIYFFKLY